MRRFKYLNDIFVILMHQNITIQPINIPKPEGECTIRFESAFFVISRKLNDIGIFRAFFYPCLNTFRFDPLKW